MTIIYETQISAITEFAIDKKEKGYNVIVVLDIDDTVLSSENRRKFVDKKILQLIEFADNISFDNLWFLTARDYELKRKTQNSLNSAKLLHKGGYIAYHVVHSPYYYGQPTKGTTLTQELIPRVEKLTFKNNENNWYIIVDDDLSQINDMHEHMSFHKYNYTLFHYNGY